MPVSKKKKYESSQFKNTSGYKKNAHRDKYGHSQQERDKRHQDYLDNRKSYRPSLKDTVRLYKELGALVGVSKRVNKQGGTL